MGGRAHGLAMGRPVALHALPLLLGGGVEGIACAGARSRSGRTAFAQRRAHRLARPFRSLCRPQRGRAVGPVCRPCRKGARASGPCASAPLFGRRDCKRLPGRAGGNHGLARPIGAHRGARSSDRGGGPGRGDPPLFGPHRTPRPRNRGTADGRPRGDLRRGLSPALSRPAGDACPLVQETRLELHGQSYRPACFRSADPRAHRDDGGAGYGPMNFLPLSFGAPMVLWGLIALPVIWWLLRLTPPRPQQETFPPLAILARIVRREETPHKSPWWLTLLRLVLAALVILALADPVVNPRERVAVSGEGLAIVLDNGW